MMLMPDLQITDGSVSKSPPSTSTLGTTVKRKLTAMFRVSSSRSTISGVRSLAVSINFPIHQLRFIL